jgi:VCBS repeat-containing protein
METAAGDEAVEGSSAFLEEVGTDQSELLGFGRGADEAGLLGDGDGAGDDGVADQFNDQPDVLDVTVGDGADVIYESSDADASDGTKDDVDTTITGTLSALDNDANDSHVFDTSELVVTSGDIDPTAISVTSFVLTNNEHGDDTPNSANFEIVGNFNALGAGESATLTFTYTATDDNPLVNQPNESDPATYTIVVTGTNDQPVISAISVNGGNVLFETHDDTDVPNVEDTQEDVLTTVTGVIDTVTDDDVNDTHTYELVDGTVMVNGVVIDSSMVNVAFNQATQNWEYTISGDFNYVANGENAVVTFDYVAVDSSGVGSGDANNESSVSQPATVTMTLTGTNDQPIVTDINVNGANNTLIFESHDDTDVAGVEDTQADVLTTVRGVIDTVTDDDASDTHTYELVNGTVMVNGQVVDQSLVDVSFNNITQNWEYTISGDFNYLDAQETATITFDYVAIDSSGVGSGDANNESSVSEPATVTLTLTGTNDQPIVTDINANGGMGNSVTGTSHTEVHNVAGSNQEGSVEYTYFSVHETTHIAIDAMRSGGNFIDPYLYILRNDGDLSSDDFIRSDDDGGTYLNSRIHITLEAGEYVAAVGDYHLSLQEVINGINPSSASPGEITLTFNANHNITLHDSNATNRVIYESYDDTDVAGDIDTQADVLTTFTGVIDTVTDDDNNDGGSDTHTYELVDGTVMVDGVVVDSSMVNVAFNAQSGDWEYTISGDFNYLDIGENATITFDYVAIDSSGVGSGDANNESSVSEPATVTLTLTGTNDQPIVTDETNVVSEESLIDGVALEDARYVGSVAQNVSDDDNNDGGSDTHTFAIDEGTLTLSLTTANQGFLSLFDINNLDAFEQFVEGFTDGNIDVSILNQDANTDVADSVTVATTVDIPQEFIEVLEQYGILNIAMDADGTYSVQSPLFNFLGASDSITIGFDYRATDSAGITTDNGVDELSESEAATVTLTVVGSNDQPVAYEADYATVESQLADTTIGGINATFTDTLPGADSNNILADILTRSGLMSGDAMDEDILDTTTLTFHLGDAPVSTTVVEGQPNDGIDVVDASQTVVVVNEDGTFSVINPTFDNLAVGENATVTFEYYIDDGSGAVATPENAHENTQSIPVAVTVTITGTNDTPVLNSVTTDTDFMETDLTGAPWGNPNRPENSFVSGQLVADISDDDVNDTHEFVAFGPTNAVVVDTNGVITGNTRVSLDADGNYQVFNRTFNNLADGEKVTVSFDVQVTDGSNGPGESAISNTQTVTLTITGTNDQPVVKNVWMRVSESSLDSDIGGNEDAVFEGTLTSTDEDTNNTNPHYKIVGDVEVSQNAVGITAADITLALANANNGGWNTSGDYTISSDKFNSLREGEVLRVRFDYKASDWEGFGTSGDGENEASHSNVKTVTLRIVGTNDVAVISPDIATGNVVEDFPFTAQGMLGITDEDFGQSLFNTNPNSIGYSATHSEATPYGTFAMTANGLWTYTLDQAKAQSLGDETVQETYVVQSIDGSASQPITITIHGQNDAPQITSSVGSAYITENGVIDGAVTQTTVLADIDATDVDSPTLTYSIIGGNSAGYFEINADGEITLTSAGESAIAASLVNDQTFDLAIEVSDGTDSDTTTVSIVVDDNFVEIPTIDLPASMDSGISDSDNLTNVTNPVLDLGNVATDALQVSIIDASSNLQAQALRSSVTGLWIVNNAGDGSLSFSGGDWTFTPDSALADGTHTYTVVVVDDAGNEEHSSLSLNIDTTAPTIDTSGVADSVNETLTHIGQVVFTDANGPVTFAVTDANFVIDAAGNLSFAVDANGVPLLSDFEDATSHSVTVTATDAAGNTSNETVNIDVNNVTGNVEFTIGNQVLIHTFDSVYGGWFNTYQYDQNDGWSVNGGEHDGSGGRGALGWFDGSGDTATQNFSLADHSGDTVTINVDVDLKSFEDGTEWWDGSQDTFVMKVYDGSDVLASQNVTSSGTVTLGFEVPDDGNFRVEFSTQNTESIFDSWKIDNFEIIGQGEKILSFDSPTDGTIDLSSYLAQNNDTVGGTTDSLDTIDLNGATSLNISIDDVLDVTDNNELRITSDGGNDNSVTLDANITVAADQTGTPAGFTAYEGIDGTDTVLLTIEDTITVEY